MKWNFFKELWRKAIHLLILFVIAGYIFMRTVYGEKYALMALVLLLLAVLVLEYIRLDLGIRMKFYEHFIRPKEVDRMCGAVFFLSATIISFAVFDFRIALAALLMVAFGDMLAAIIGQKFGHTLIFQKKTMLGGLAELMINIIIGFVVLYTLTNVYVILAMAFMATFSEIVVEHIDDNLIVPLFTGFIGQLLLML